MQPDEGRELLASGAAAYARGDVAGALRTFEHAVRSTTGDIRLSAMINAASMSDQLGEHAAAITAYRRALAAMPEHAVRMRPTALVNMSQALQHVGDLDGAQAALEQARALLADGADQGALRVACLLSLTAVAIHRQQWVQANDLAVESLDAALHFAPHLAGHPLMNLAAIHFETGRAEPAVDFAEQALVAFDAAGDRNAVAETQQNLAIMHIRSDRLDDAEPLLPVAQQYFEQSGLGHRCGIGLKVMGFLAEGRGRTDRAHELYGRSLEYFLDTGAVLDAADVRTRLATLAFAAEQWDEGETLLAGAFGAYAEHGLGLHCAQIDYWHAALLESVIDSADPPAPSMLARAVDLAVPAALAIDAVRYTLPNGNQRQQWNSRIADPAMRLAFRFAYLSGDARLVADLVETQCAGTTVSIDRSEGRFAARLPLELLDPPSTATGGPEVETLALGAALADVAASVGLAVSPPPRIAVAPDGRIALATYIAAAERRYGRRIRDSRVLPA